MMSSISFNLDKGVRTADDYCDYKTKPESGNIIDSKRKDGGDSPSSCFSLASETTKILQLSTRSIPASNVTASVNNKKELVREMSALEILVSPSYKAASQFIFRQGGQLRTLIEDALIKVVTSAIMSASSSSFNQQKLHKSNQLFSGAGQEDESLHISMGVLNSTKTQVDSSCHILQNLLQQRKAECLILEQRIDSQKLEIAQLQARVDDLRENKKQQISNERQLRATLKRVSDEAMLARDNANRAKASSTALKKHIDTLEKTIRETKRTSMFLLQEQEEIGIGVERMEKEFVQIKNDLIRCSVTKRNMEQDRHILSQRFRCLRDSVEKIQDNLDFERSQRLLTKRKYNELEVKVQVEQNRSKRLQEDLDSTQALLLESTSASAESKHTVEDCKQAFARVEEANRHLHHQLTKKQAVLRHQEASYEKELDRTKILHRETQLELNNEKERFQKIKLEKLAIEKLQESQAAKIFALERRLKESTNLMATTMNAPSSSRLKKITFSEKSSDEEKKGNNC